MTAAAIAVGAKVRVKSGALRDQRGEVVRVVNEYQGAGWGRGTSVRVASVKLENGTHVRLPAGVLEEVPS